MVVHFLTLLIIKVKKIIVKMKLPKDACNVVKMPHERIRKVVGIIICPVIY
jgi:hypothetical protein